MRDIKELEHCRVVANAWWNAEPGSPEYTMDAADIIHRERAAARNYALAEVLSKVEAAGMKHTAATLRHLMRWLKENHAEDKM